MNFYSVHDLRNDSMNIVLDINVLVSALWSADSKPAIIINSVLNR